MNRDMPKLNTMLGLGFIANDFNLGKFADNKRHHLVHEMIKHGERIGSLTMRTFLSKEKGILEAFERSMLSFRNGSCPRGKHLKKYAYAFAVK